MYVLLGCVGFLAGFSLESAVTQRIPGLRRVLWGAAYGLVAWSLCMVSLQGMRLDIPAWLSVVGWGLLPVALLLLLYSLFFELPFRSTYLRSRPDSHLVTSGTHALVRHPAVLWYGLLLVSLLFVTRSQLLLVALPLWLGLDIVWVVLQERLSLPRTYSYYQRYRISTPMLVPNWHSLRACLATLRPPRGQTADATRR